MQTYAGGVVVCMMPSGVGGCEGNVYTPGQNTHIKLRLPLKTVPAGIEDMLPHVLRCCVS